MTHFLSIVFQTIQKVIVNRNTFLIFSIASIFYLVFYSIPYSNQSITKIHTAIVDLDQSQTSQNLVNQLTSTPIIYPQLQTSDYAQALSAFRSAKLDVMIVIPANMENDLNRGSPTSISVFSNGAFPVKGRAVAAIAQLIVGQENVQFDVQRLLKEGIYGRVVKKMTMSGPTFVSQDLYNNISGYGIYMVPMVAIVIVQAIMFFGVGISLGGWCQERTQWPWAQLVFSQTQSLIAVFVGFWLIAFAWTLLLEGVGMWLLGIPALLNLPATVVAVACFSLSITALAMSLALAMGTNRYAAGMVLASAPAVFLSGLVYPFENFATWVVPFAWLLPSTPACRSVLFASQEGATVIDILPLFLVNLGQFLIYVSILIWLYKKKYSKDLK